MFDIFGNDDDSKAPRKCMEYDMYTKKDMIDRIISMILSDNNLFGYKDILDDYIFNCQYFYDQLMSEEQIMFERALRQGIPRLPSIDSIIGYVGPVRFFKKYALFVEEPDKDPGAKFKFFLRKYLNKYNTTYLCQIIEMLKNKLSSCAEMPKEHTVILVDRNSARVNILKQKQQLGAPITTSDIEILEDDKIMELKLDDNDDIYSQENINKGIYNRPMIKNIYDKALDNKAFLLDVFPTNDIVTALGTTDVRKINTVKRIFKQDYNTNTQFVALLANVMYFLNDMQDEMYSKSSPPGSGGSSDSTGLPSGGSSKGGGKSSGSGGSSGGRGSDDVESVDSAAAAPSSNPSWFNRVFAHIDSLRMKKKSAPRRDETTYEFGSDDESREPLTGPDLSKDTRLIASRPFKRPIANPVDAAAANKAIMSASFERRLGETGQMPDGETVSKILSDIVDDPVKSRGPSFSVDGYGDILPWKPSPPSLLGAPNLYTRDDELLALQELFADKDVRKIIPEKFPQGEGNFFDKYGNPTMQGVQAYLTTFHQNGAAPSGSLFGALVPTKSFFSPPIYADGVNPSENEPARHEGDDLYWSYGKRKHKKSVKKVRVIKKKSKSKLRVKSFGKTCKKCGKKSYKKAKKAKKQ